LARRQNDQTSLGLSLGYLGNTYSGEERFAEAENSFQQALSTWQRISQTNIHVPEMLRDLGAVYSIEGRNELALATLKQALQSSNKVAEPHVELVAEIFNSLGIAYSRQGNYKKAESFFVQTMQMRTAGALTDRQIAAALGNLAVIYRKKRRYTDAEAAFRNSLEITIRISGCMHPDVALTRAGLGQIYMDMGRFDQAEAEILESLRITRQMNPILQQRVMRTMYLLSDIYVRSRKMAQAEETLAQAVEIARHSHERDPENAMVLEAYSNLLKHLGRAQEAEALHIEARHIRAAMSLTAPVHGVK
jgi:tetratricopeptide (TPR) repeat protein